MLDYYKKNGIKNYGGNSIAVPFIGNTNLALGGVLTIKLAAASSVGALSFYGLKVTIASQNTLGNLEATIKVATDSSCTLWTALGGGAKIEYPMFDKTCFTPWLVIRSDVGNFANSLPEITDVSWDSSSVPSSPMQVLIPGLAIQCLLSLTDISGNIPAAKTPLLNLLSRIDSLYLLADDYTTVRGEVIDTGEWANLVPRRCWIRYAATIVDPMAPVSDISKVNILMEDPNTNNFSVLGSRDIENKMFCLNARLTAEEIRVIYRATRNMQ